MAKPLDVFDFATLTAELARVRASVAERLTDVEIAPASTGQLALGGRLTELVKHAASGAEAAWLVELLTVDETRAMAVAAVFEWHQGALEPGEYGEWSSEHAAIALDG